MNPATRTPQKVKLLDGPLDGRITTAEYVVIGKQMTGPKKWQPVYGLEYLLVLDDPDDSTLKHRYVRQAGGGYYLFDGTRQAA